MFKTKPTPEQVAALLRQPTDPDAMMRRRLEGELRRIVNHAALYGLEAPAPEKTVQGQIRASQCGILPHAMRDIVMRSDNGKTHYDNLSHQVHGGVWKGD